MVYAHMFYRSLECLCPVEWAVAHAPVVLIDILAMDRVDNKTVAAPKQRFNNIRAFGHRAL